MAYLEMHCLIPTFLKIFKDVFLFLISYSFSYNERYVLYDFDCYICGDLFYIPADSLYW